MRIPTQVLNLMFVVSQSSNSASLNLSSQCSVDGCNEVFSKHYQLRSEPRAPGTKPCICTHPGCTKSFTTNQKLVLPPLLHKPHPRKQWRSHLTSLYHDYLSLKCDHGQVVVQKVIKFRLAHFQELRRVAEEEGILPETRWYEVGTVDVLTLTRPQRQRQRSFIFYSA
jgi:hypothetical protein